MRRAEQQIFIPDYFTSIIACFWGATIKVGYSTQPFECAVVTYLIAISNL